MKSKLFLHVGPPKTATTTLQHFLANNRVALAAAGIAYPLTEQSHWKLAANLGLKMWHWSFDPAAPTWDDVARSSSENSDKHLLLSSESFSYAALSSKKEAAEKLFEHLKALGRDIRVIIYLRRQDLWVESYFIEYLKHFGQGGMEAFLEARKESLDYYRVVSFWASLAGKENVTVRVYEKQQLPDIRQDFLQTLGIADTSVFQLNEDQNHRPNLLQMQVLKNYVDTFHAHFPSPGNDFNKPFGELDNNLGGFLYQASQWQSPHQFRILPWQKAKEMLTACEASNTRVAREFLGRADGQLFFEELSPYEHDELRFPETLDDAQKSAVASLWKKTCDLMGQPTTDFPPLKTAATFTGERYLPSMTDFQISYEHWHRYFYVTHFSAGKTVLDIACGEGYGAFLLSENAAKVVGVDIDGEAVRQAADKYRQANLSFLTGSVARIPIEGEAVFDLIVSFETIEHVDNDAQAAFLSEVKRLLRPGGVFIVSTPNKLLYSDLPNYKNEFHVKEFYEGEFADFLRSHFGHVEVLGQDVYTSSYIRQPDGNSGFSEFNLALDNVFKPQKAAAGQDAYMVAVCSEKPLAPLPSSLLFNSKNKRANYDLSYQMLYLDTGEGFNESEALLADVHEKNKPAVFDLSGFSGIKNLRFDPAACPAYLKINGISLETTEGKRVAVSFSTNALQEEAPFFLFDTDDPQVHLDFPHSGAFKTAIFDLEYLALGAEVYPYLKKITGQKASESVEKTTALNEALAKRETEIGNLSKELQTNAWLLGKADEQNTLQKKLTDLAESYLAAQKAANEDLSQRLAAAAEQLTAQKHLTEQTARTLTEQQATANALARRLTDAEELIKLKEDQLRLMADNLSKSVESAKKLEAALADRGEELKNRDAQIQLLLQNAQAALHNIEALQAGIFQKEETIAEQHEKLAQRLRKLKAARIALETLEQANTATCAQLATALEEKTALQNETELVKNNLEAQGKTFRELEQRSGDLNHTIAALENAILEKDSNYTRLERDNRAKTKYIGELHASLSFRLGWALTAPFRWIYDSMKFSFWRGFLATGFKHPGSFFKNITPEKIGVLWRALKNEPPSLILRNLGKLLSGTKNELRVSPKSPEPAPVSTLASPPAGAIEAVEERKAHFFIDQLTELDFHFSIRGWLFAESHEIESLSIAMSQGERRVAAELFYRIDRLDVFQHFGNKNGIRSGFEDSVEKPFSGKVQLHLVATFKDGGSAILDLGETEFREPFLRAFEGAMLANRSAFLAPNGAKKSGQPSIGIYTNSKGNYFFNEIKKLVAAGFWSLGFEVLDLDETDGFDNEAQLHLVIAPHEFFALGEGSNFTKKPSDRLVLLNTEQPSSEWFGKGTSYFPYAVEVWDMNFYSSQRLLKNLGHARFLPLGYMEGFDLLGEVRLLPDNYCTCFLDEKIRANSFLNSPFEERPIDILFVGHASQRRQQFFAKHAAFFSKYNCYFHLTDLSLGPVLDTGTNMNTRTAIGLAQRSKIILNIHHGSHSYFEWHRMVMHGIWQRGLVVSDPCSEGLPFEPGRDFISAPLDELPERIQYFLDTANGRRRAREIIEQAHTTLTTRCDLAAALRGLVQPLLEKTEASPLTPHSSSLKINEHGH